jgi:hypothetical protein
MAGTSWWSRLRRVPAPVVDAGLALALAVAVTAAIDVASTRGDGRAPGAYTLGLAVAALVLFRRRWPLAVLLFGEAVRSRRLLVAEQERSERLLLNVLPAPIAARLKQGEAVIAEANWSPGSCSRGTLRPAEAPGGSPPRTRPRTGR